MQYSDHLAYKLPVSVKGILHHNNKFLLRRNERDEWELIGGKLEPQEIPQTCVQREIKEETNIEVNINNLIDVWIYTIAKGVSVLIVTYSCNIKKLLLPVISPENAILDWFTLSEIESLNMPDGYKNSLRTYTQKENGKK